MALLVDSSVWIAGADAKNEECLLLKRMVQRGDLLYIATPIQVEVCQGARSEFEFRRLWDAFLGFNFLEISRKHWELCAWNYYRCWKKGITPTTIDCLIATLAAEYRIELWSIDKVFKSLGPILGFDLRGSGSTR